MKGKILRCVLVCVVALTMIVSGTACSSQESSTKAQPESTATDTKATDTKAQGTAEKKAPVTIKFYNSYDTASDIGKLSDELIKRFQEKYGAEVNLVVENTPNIDANIQKIKMMYASGETPDLINAAGYDIVWLGAKGDKVADLKPYLDADPELKSYFTKTNLDFNTHDGKLTSLGNTNYIAMYYNKDLFKKVGITPAKTWDEFWSNCDKLKAAGITPMVMDTRDTAWITNLLLGAIIGSSGDTGTKFMNEYHPKDYNTPIVIDAMKKIQKCFKEYAQKNAAGADYNAAASNFLSGKAAMIFNGPWMIVDMSDKTKAIEGLANNVATCLYPNDTVYAGGTTGYVVGNTTKEKMDACVKFIKYYQSTEIQAELAVRASQYPESPLVKFTEEQKTKAPLLIQTIEMINTAKVKICDYQSHWYPFVCDQFSVLYPQLIYDKITPEDFAKKLTEIAKKAE